MLRPPKTVCGFVPLLIMTFSVAPLAAHTDISAGVAHDMIASDAAVVVLDVREYYEFCGSVAHIEDAASLPWNSGVLQPRIDELPADLNIIVVCGSGGRSHLAATFLDGQGFTKIYDMLGGMSAWAWDKESCGGRPDVVMHKTPSGSEINWTPATDFQDYDLIRGWIEDVSDAGDVIDLGSVDCLCQDSPFTYFMDSEPFQGVLFYIARQAGGSWGESSAHEERTPASFDCAP